MAAYDSVMVLAVLATALAPVHSEILYGETATVAFEAWAADLNSGFTLHETNIEGRTCFCKGTESYQNTQGSYNAFASAGIQTSSNFDMQITHDPFLDHGGQGESSFDYVTIKPPGK